MPITNDRKTEILNTIRIAVMPKRKDGLPDLGASELFVNELSFSNLGEMIFAIEAIEADEKQHLIACAVSRRKDQIASHFLNMLFTECLSVKEAISILDLTKDKVIGSRFEID